MHNGDLGWVWAGMRVLHGNMGSGVGPGMRGLACRAGLQAEADRFRVQEGVQGSNSGKEFGCGKGLGVGGQKGFWVAGSR